MAIFSVNITIVAVSILHYPLRTSLYSRLLYIVSLNINIIKIKSQTNFKYASNKIIQCLKTSRQNCHIYMYVQNKLQPIIKCGVSAFYGKISARTQFGSIHRAKLPASIH